MHLKIIAEALIIRQGCVLRLDIHGVVISWRVVRESCLNIGYEALRVDGHVWRDDGCRHGFREVGYDCPVECGYSAGLVNIWYEVALSYGSFDAESY